MASSVIKKSDNIIVGAISVEITNGDYALPNSVLNGWTGDYICISGGLSLTASIGYNSLVGQAATKKSSSDPSATYGYSVTMLISYCIIKC